MGRFVREAQRLGVRVYRSSGDEVVRVLVEILRAEGARRVGLSEGLKELLGPLRDAGFAVGGVEVAREAEVGVTGADWGLAETGSLVLLTGPTQDRLLSLLPPVHVALLPEDRILTDIEALFECLDEVPSALIFITGPSRTADIEQTLTPGVHGPGVVYVVLYSSTRLAKETIPPAGSGACP